MSLNLAKAVLGSKWLIHQGWAESQLPIIMGLLDGGKWERAKAANHKSNEKPDAEFEFLFCAAHYDEKSGNFTTAYYDKLSEAPKGAVAVINVDGPLMKNGGDCGEPGHVHYQKFLNEAKNNPNIIGVLMPTDSPGGQANGTKAVVDEIRNMGKPVVGFINNGMAASAAAWYLSNCTEIYASQATDEFGSIGTYCTIADFSKRYEMLGVKIHEIYAPQSTLKNKDYKDVLKGDYARVEEDLKFLTEEFINSVKEGRGDRINKAGKDAFKGEMYYAQAAIDNGLIDGIKTFDEALIRVYELADAGKETNNKKQTENKMELFGKKFTKLEALVGKEVVTAEELNAVNSEITEKGITALEIVPKGTVASLETLETVTNELATAKNSVTELTSKLAEANTAKDAAIAASEAVQTKLDASEKEVERLGAIVPGAGAGKPVNTGAGAEEATPAYFNPNHAHNQKPGY